MPSNNFTFTSDNTKVVEFYTKNPHLDFDAINCTFIDLIENIQKDITGNLNTTISRDILSTIKDLSSELSKELSTELTQFQTDFTKLKTDYIGKLNEGKLFIVLNNLYPNHEIIDCSNKSKHGDIILRRQTYKDVIFENKHYTSNVPKEDVFKFIRDCEEQNSSGILLSNCSGISNKNNFQIDITTENNVLIYIHKAEYDEFKIQTAVNIIDHITTILNQIKKETNKNIITDDIMIDINQEFQTFLNQKETLINLIRETNKKIISQITDIELPSLQKLLSSKFASTKTLDLKCDICSKFTGSNLKSLSIHKRKCSTNKNNNNNKEDTGSDTPVENNTIVEIKKNNKKK